MVQDSFRLYELAAQFLLNELRLLSERTNFFLTTNSILVAGLLFAPNSSAFFIRIALCTLGVVSCFLQISTTRAAIIAAHFWRTYMRNMEEDNPTFQSFKDLEISPLIERNKYYSGKSTLTNKASGLGYDTLRDISSWDKNITMRKLSPQRVISIIFPILFLSFWISAILWLTLV